MCAALVCSSGHRWQSASVFARIGAQMTLHALLKLANTPSGSERDGDRRVKDTRRRTRLARDAIATLDVHPRTYPVTQGTNRCH